MIEDEDFGEFSQTGWVIPHGTALDYCRVDVLREDQHGRLFVEGCRYHGWKPDGALVKCKIAADKLTQIPSWHLDFLELYDDPHRPERSA